MKGGGGYQKEVHRRMTRESRDDSGRREVPVVNALCPEPTSPPTPLPSPSMSTFPIPVTSHERSAALQAERAEEKAAAAAPAPSRRTTHHVSSPSVDSSSIGSGSSDADSSEYDEEEELRLAQQEWDRLVSQTKLILGLAVPFIAGFYGRKFGLRGESLLPFQALERRRMRARERESTRDHHPRLPQGG